MLTARVADSIQVEDSRKSIFLSFNYSPEVVAKVRELPTRCYNIRTREWEVPYHDADLILNRFDNVVGLTLPEQSRARNRLSGVQADYQFDFKTVPFPHQVEAFNFGLRRNTLLIADEQGLGKTKESLDIAVARKAKNGITGVLIICGVNSVKYNWVEEIRIHTHESAELIEGDVNTKMYLLRNNPNFFSIINVESLRRKEVLDEIVNLIDHNKINMVIFDEVHKAKNGQCQQGKALKKINPPFKLALTGTPITSKAEDLWNVLHWLGYERSSFWQFKSRYCIMGGYGGHSVVGYKNLDELSIKLKKAMIRRKKEEVFDLPPKIHSYEHVELTTKQKQHYRIIRQGLLKRMDEIVALPNPLSELMRLRQCTSGLEVLEVDDSKDNPKLDRLKELLEEVIIPNGKKVVIFSQWGKVTRILKRELKKYNPAYITGEVKDTKRQAEVVKFQNDPTCKVCIGTISAMGVGLTLTAGEYVVFMDRAWTAADNEQAEDRCHRIGTTGTVNVITFIAHDTIDERVEDIIRKKKELTEAVVEGRAIKQNMREMMMSLLA